MPRKLTQQEFEERVYKKFDNTVTVLNEYRGRRCLIKLQCLICNYEWETNAGNVMDIYYKGQCLNCQTHKKIVQQICKLCNNNFILNGKQGGQNREFCYECLPNGMNRQERNKYKRKLLTKTIRQNKENIGCFVCGYNKCGAALDWHHIEKNNTEHNPCELAYRSFTAYLIEINKCRLLCANCHRELHYYINHANTIIE